MCAVCKPHRLGWAWLYPKQLLCPPGQACSLSAVSCAQAVLSYATRSCLSRRPKDRSTLPSMRSATNGFERRCCPVTFCTTLKLPDARVQRSMVQLTSPAAAKSSFTNVEHGLRPRRNTFIRLSKQDTYEDCSTIDWGREYAKDRLRKLSTVGALARFREAALPWAVIAVL